MNWRLYSWMRFTCGRAGGRAVHAWPGWQVDAAACPALKTLQAHAVHINACKASGLRGTATRNTPAQWPRHPIPVAGTHLDVEQRLGGDLVAGHLLDVRRQVGLLLLLDGAPAGAEAGVLGKGLELLQQGGILHPGVSAQGLHVEAVGWSAGWVG